MVLEFSDLFAIARTYIFFINMACLGYLETPYAHLRTN
jgi:hypothetical protein